MARLPGRIGLQVETLAPPPSFPLPASLFMTKKKCRSFSKRSFASCAQCRNPSRWLSQDNRRPNKLVSVAMPCRTGLPFQILLAIHRFILTCVMIAISGSIDRAVFVQGTAVYSDQHTSQSTSIRHQVNSRLQDLPEGLANAFQMNGALGQRATEDNTAT